MLISRKFGLNIFLLILYLAFYAFFASKEHYGDSLTTVFPAMANSTGENDYTIGVRIPNEVQLIKII